MLARTVGEAAARFSDRVAFVDLDDPAGPHRITYADLDRSSEEVAAGLLESGITVGDVVAVDLPTSIDYVVAYLAAAKVGAVTAGVNPRLPAADRRRVIARVAPAISIGAGGLDVGALRIPGVTVPPLTDDPDRPVAIVFTSGTTGEPRGAVFAGAQLEAVTRVDVGDAWGAGGHSLVGTSLAHLGFMTKLPGALRRGGTVHLMRRWEAGRALRLTADLGLATVAGVPTQIALMLRHPDLVATDVSSVRTVVIGGAPATPDLVRRARESFAAPVCVRYSCTEAGVGTGTRPDDPPEDAEETVGRPHHGVEVAIRDGDGAEVPIGEIGEVWLRSAAVMSGYWADPAATAQALTEDGFVRTGDLGAFDGERLRLVGRAKEMFVRGGYNVYPLRVEAVLGEHPAVREAVVVAAPDEVMGEIGVAFVVPARSGAPSLEDLRAAAAGDLAWYELPERLVIVQELPLTPGEKVDRARLAATAADYYDSGVT